MIDNFVKQFAKNSSIFCPSMTTFSLGDRVRIPSIVVLSGGRVASPSTAEVTQWWRKFRYTNTSGGLLRLSFSFFLLQTEIVRVSGEVLIKWGRRFCMCVSVIAEKQCREIHTYIRRSWHIHWNTHRHANAHEQSDSRTRTRTHTSKQRSTINSLLTRRRLRSSCNNFTSIEKKIPNISYLTKGGLTWNRKKKPIKYINTLIWININMSMYTN